jgi:hypothetical protein
MKKDIGIDFSDFIRKLNAVKSVASKEGFFKKEESPTSLDGDDGPVVDGEMSEVD